MRELCALSPLMVTLGKLCMPKGNKEGHSSGKSQTPAEARLRRATRARPLGWQGKAVDVHLWRDPAPSLGGGGGHGQAQPS